MKVVDIEAILPDSFSWNKHVEEVKSKGCMVLEGEHKRKDGTTFPVEVNVRYIGLQERQYMVAVARDITERKMMEEKYGNNTEKLEERKNLVLSRMLEENFISQNGKLPIQFSIQNY